MSSRSHQYAIEKEVFDRQTSRVSEVKRTAGSNLIHRLETILKNFGDEKPWNRLHGLVCKDPDSDIWQIYRRLRTEHHQLLS